MTPPTGTKPEFAAIGRKTREIALVDILGRRSPAYSVEEWLILELACVDGAALAAFKPRTRMVEPKRGGSSGSVQHRCRTDVCGGGALEVVVGGVSAAVGRVGALAWCGLTGDVKAAASRLVLSARRCGRGVGNGVVGGVGL